MIDGEDLMDYDELLEGCESPIETHLLRALYPELGPDAQKEIQAQYMIDYYDMPVIPPRANRRDSRTYDVHLYKERHLVECFINKIKQYRRISSRFDKLAVRYMGFLSFVATIIWVR